MHTVQIYRRTVRSFLPLPGPEVFGEEPDIDLICSPDHAPRPFEPDLDSRLYSNPDPQEGRVPLVEFHRRGGWHCLRYPESVDFFFRDRGPVACFPRPEVAPEVLQALVLGPLCAVLLELQGVICLHASAVCLGESAVGLAGQSGAGKSTLTASLVDHGHPLLADDILPLEIRGEDCLAVPGYPQLKLSRDALRKVDACAEAQITGSIGDKETVAVGQGWGAFFPAPVPLRVVYVLDRGVASRGKVSIEPLPPRGGFVELLRFGFCARLASALGLSPKRFEFLAEAGNCIAVRRLRFPNDLSLLEDVERAICDDLARLCEGQALSGESTRERWAGATSTE
ncbi:MAG: hypothetical protein HQ582_34525 [Planctomycetes bacterium]|nr:hypothetical protein [Planctomycetota bacterium]